MPARAQTVVPHGAILLARRLGPAELLDWHARGIAGVVVEDGSATGHAAILARALGLPMLGGARGALDAAEDGDEALLDAEEALLVLRPEQEVRQAYQRELEARSDRLARWASLRDLPSVTADGTQVRLMLNVGLALELAQLDAHRGGRHRPVPHRDRACWRAAPSPTWRSRPRSMRACWTPRPGGRWCSARSTSAATSCCRAARRRRRRTRRWAGAACASGSTGRRCCAASCARCCWRPPGGRCRSCSRWWRRSPSSVPPAALLLAEAARVRPAPETLQIGTMLEVPALMWQLPELLREVRFHLASAPTT